MLKLHDIIRAQQRLAPYIQPAPLVRSPALSEISGADVWLKLENRQPTGSFKIRGALHKLLLLDDAARNRGVVTASAGNHGLGVAFAARALGLNNVTIFVPETTPTAVGSAVATHLNTTPPQTP
ncbi:MAG: pyridoxal-phosphate dependent enzyme, partial [Chloroflexi bacterium]